jgi:hypothetical protein
MMERFMTIEEGWDSRYRREWWVCDVADATGTRAVTFGLGPHLRKIKKAVIVLVAIMFILWLVKDKLTLGVALFFYGIWTIDLFGSHKALYRVIQNPKDNLWYVIGNAGPNPKIWIPCSEGFKSQLEAILDAKLARDEHDR